MTRPPVGGLRLAGAHAGAFEGGAGGVAHPREQAVGDGPGFGWRAAVALRRFAPTGGARFALGVSVELRTVEAISVEVDNDGIAVLDEGDGAAHVGLGR